VDYISLAEAPAVARVTGCGGAQYNGEVGFGDWERDSYQLTQETDDING
jgi:hypothetical protein